MTPPEEILADMQAGSPLRQENANLKRKLENLLEQIEIDGSLIHSTQCGCNICEAIAEAEGAAAGWMADESEGAK